MSQAHMSRPSGPLDRAAAHAQRESLHLRRDRLGSMAQRAARARRRAFFSGVATLVTVIAWVLSATTGTPAWIAGLATGAMVTVVGASVRAGAAERAALADTRAVDREVRAAATAMRALKVVSAGRASGKEAQPSDVATQAIRIITATDLAPLKASVRQQTARQLSEDDYAASSHAAHQAAQSEAKTDRAVHDVPRTGALDAILAKRRQASA